MKSIGKIDLILARIMQYDIKAWFEVFINGLDRRGDITNCLSSEAEWALMALTDLKVYSEEKHSSSDMDM